jgi:selenocysteine-specific elongation factor
MPHVIGTAGHVDHGKSALVLGLTGTDPDRLAEEKARGMTIDLGFAWTTLPSGREVGFVDVPGHERFVHNMLAGVGGVDCALLVVDAAEGWQPQSAEHLAILDLLGIATGVAVLTKVDLVGRDRVAEVAGQVRERLAGTTLAGAAVVETAAPVGLGLDRLRQELDRALDRVPEPPDRGRPRLPVDRVFSIRGSGTVVTGTLSGGALDADAEAVLLPAGRRVRIRGLQTHGRPAGHATPARRVAVNLAGVATGQVARGDVLALPGQWRPTRTADCRLRCLPGAAGPLRARGAYLLYAGAAEAAVRLQPLDAIEVPPGEHALVRLHLDAPLVLDPFEPVVLRDSGRDETVGGGPVLDPFPPSAVRGTAARVRRVEELEAREAAGLHGLVARVLAERSLVAVADLPVLAAASREEADAQLDAAAGQGQAWRGRAVAWAPAVWRQARESVLAAVAAHHRAEPLAPGMPAQLARAAARPASTRRLARPEGDGGRGGPSGTGPGGATGSQEPVWAAGGAEAVDALVAAGQLVADGPVVRLPEHGVRLDPAQRAVRARVEEALAAGGVAGLSEADLVRLGADRRLRAALVRLGVLVPVGAGLHLGRDAFDQAVASLRAAFPGGRTFSATEAKQAMGTTRKTAIPLLEHLDRSGVTIRQGDLRRLAEGGGPEPRAGWTEERPTGEADQRGFL